jgi:hypothetical protein
MIPNPRLTRYDHLVASRRRPGNSCLRHDDVVSANATIMPNLNEIVDLASLSNACGAECAAIDCGARADLDIILNFHVAKLGDFNMLPIQAAITKTIRTDNTIRVDDDAVSDDCPLIKHDMRVQDDIFPDTTTSPDNNSGMQYGSGSDPHGRTDDDMGTDTNIFRNGCRRVDDGCRMNPNLYCWHFGFETLENRYERC